MDAQTSVHNRELTNVLKGLCVTFCSAISIYLAAAILNDLGERQMGWTGE